MSTVAIILVLAAFGALFAVGASMWALGKLLPAAMLQLEYAIAEVARAWRRIGGAA